MALTSSIKVISRTATQAHKCNRNGFHTDFPSIRVIATSTIRSFSAEAAPCPFKTLADIPGGWDEEIPILGDHSHFYNPSGMYKYSSYGRPVLGVFSSNGTKDVLRLDGSGTGKTSFPPQIIALLGQNAFPNKYGKDHSRIRRVLNPLFTDSAIKSRYDGIWNATDDLLDSLYTKTAECKDDEYVHVQPLTRQWAWDIGMSVVLGVGDIVTKEESERMRHVFATWLMGFLDTNMSNVDTPGTPLGDGMIARYFVHIFM